MKQRIDRIWIPSKIKIRIKVLSAKEGMSIQKYLEKHFGGEEDDNGKKGGFRGIF